MIINTPVEISYVTEGGYYTADIKTIEHWLQFIHVTLEDREVTRACFSLFGVVIQGFISNELRTAIPEEIVHRCGDISYTMKSMSAIYQLLNACVSISDSFVYVHDAKSNTAKSPVI